jgi:hypothetical protein
VNVLELEADLNDTLASQLVYTHVEIISSAGASQGAGGWLNRACSGCTLVDNWSISWWRYWYTFSASSFKPCYFGDLNLPESLFRGVTEGGTKLQIRDICNISLVLFAIEDVDVIVFHI